MNDIEKLAKAINKKVYDNTFRKQIKQNPKRYAKELLTDNYDDGLDYSISTSSKDITYFTIPYYGKNFNTKQINAGAVGSFGCASSAGTLGSACGSVSSASTSGSIGTLGSAKV